MFVGATCAAGQLTPDLPRPNVCLWDTLLARPLVDSFPAQDSGATSLLYSPRHQLLIVGGKKGGMFAYDMRMRKLFKVPASTSFRPTPIY